MPEAQRDLVPEDEIDFGRLGRRVGAVIGYPFRLLARHPFVTFLFLIAAVAFAISAKYTIGRQYESTFIIKPLDRNERFHLRMLGDLQVLRRQSDTAALCSLLGVDMKTAKSLSSIKADNPFIRNRSDSINYTAITISSSRPQNLVPLQAGILRYLESNPYFTKIRNLQHEQIRVQREQVDRDLVQLDSLKALQARAQTQVPAGAVTVLENLVDKSRVYVVGADRMQKKVALMAQEQFTHNFQLVKPLVTPSVHSWPPRILVMLLYTVPAMLVLCFLFLVVLEQTRSRSR